MLSLAVLSAFGCKRQARDEEELVEIGVGDASNERALGVHAPVGRGDLVAIAETGRWLHLARRAIELGDAAVVERMGNIEGDVLLPLVDIDPGGASGQVVFVRWPGARGKSEPLLVADAQRWVLVALSFAPERVIDVELLHGAPEPGSAEARRIEALVVGAEALQREAAGQAFFTVDRLVEEPVVEKKRRTKIVTVIYALAANDEGPDYELAIDEPSKRGKKAPAVLRVEPIHPRRALKADPVLVQWPDPHPLTVARALERDPKAEPLAVRVHSGLYRVAPVDGTLERIGP